MLPLSAHHQHLVSFGELDVQLDPFPQGGGVTTAEGLLMAVPCVTLLGERVPGRVSASMLSAVGLDDLVAQTEDEYVEIAVRLARDVDRLRHERETLRERLLASPMGNATLYTRAVEDAYRTLWRRWCEGNLTPDPSPTRRGESDGLLPLSAPEMMSAEPIFAPRSGLGGEVSSGVRVLR